MRYPEDHKAQTRQRIIDEASRRFRSEGVEATGLQTLMKALGLTHGGFYAHFKSKEELVEIALQAAFEQLAEVAGRTFGGPDALANFIDDYLSEQHRDHPERGCPFPTLSAELGARGKPSPTTDQALAERLERLEKVLPEGHDPDQAVATLATLVGALLLSRSVADPALSGRILESTRRYLKRDVAGEL
ncbi:MULTISPECIES: TetR/AcrR family transcriptional regulator [unclassified Pseudomonas]|uniref:TetR/AcrR family transcriptional regulator n=1 Tax=unclassified Pseudomonas TaxID=196821 RepID=UPI0007314E53|nr:MULTISPECIES: TetR/AcrR family transcriptional regulator [unclassified Pseudomonas]KSW27820.1 TetR family transcriptional regulator [Pseudomonas sp. ADP]OBP10721.1 TetR family transcriptional regulator [Pseudomonas sp. EGD-AKN5]QOF84489.1 TetR/AcrR family transcriptional regulator [Pseudomonas sp. ADPe]